MRVSSIFIQKSPRREGRIGRINSSARLRPFPPCLTSALAKRKDVPHRSLPSLPVFRSAARTSAMLGSAGGRPRDFLHGSDIIHRRKRKALRPLSSCFPGCHGLPPCLHIRPFVIWRRGGTSSPSPASVISPTGSATVPPVFLPPVDPFWPVRLAPLAAFFGACRLPPQRLKSRLSRVFRPAPGPPISGMRRVC